VRGRIIAAAVAAPILAVSPAGCARSPASDTIANADFAGRWSGSFHILGDSVHVFLELSAEDSVRLAGRVSLPAQGMFGLPVAVEREGRSLRLDVAALRARYEGRLRADGESLRGDWRQAGGLFRLALARTDAPLRPARPQEPVPPFPYEVTEVSFAGGGPGVVLSGTLTTPEGDGPFPAAALVSGSGPQDRDERMFGHRPFLVLADYLTRSGIAVLRYDDRGVAASTGDFASATSEDFAADAVAAVDFLATRTAIDPRRVGIVGHSEGAIVGPLAATRSGRVAFIVCLAGTGIPGRDLLELQTRLIQEASGVPAPLVALNGRVQRALLDRLEEAGSSEGALEMARQELDSAWDGLPAATLRALGLASQVDRSLEELFHSVASPWLFFFLRYDPTVAFERVRVPVLALDGSKDLQVPPDPNLYRIRDALERGGNRDVTIRELDGLNHLFQHAETGLPSEYGAIGETMAPEVLRIVSEWISARRPPDETEEDP